MPAKDLAGFLFEIASPERLAILTLVGARPLKHAQIARQLSMTGSETTRHLNRLASADLIARNARGEYEHTNLARLLTSSFPFLRFLLGNRAYILSHDLLVLPPEFLERLGALEQGAFTTGTYDVVAEQERDLRAVKRRIWVVTGQLFRQAIPIMREKAAAGLDVRIVRPRKRFEDEPPLERNYGLRLVKETPLFLAVLDDIAGVCFPDSGGKVDMEMMLVLASPRGIRWAEDLFLRFWEQAHEPLHGVQPQPD